MRILLALLLLGVALAILLGTKPLPKPPARPLPAAPPVTVSPIPPPVSPANTAVTLQHRTDEIAAKVITEVSRATRPRECAFASGSRGEARLACLFVDADAKLYQLDADLSIDAFPALKKMDFKEAEDPWARTISTYRSLAKTAMGFRAASGDRLIILLCPKSEWATVNLECTHFAPKILPAESTAPRF